MGKYASDIESTGLLDDLKKQKEPRLHNQGFKCMLTGKEILFTHDPQGSRGLVVGGDARHISELPEFLKQGHELNMHNGILYDVEALKILGVPEITACSVIDTLWISFAIQPERIRHGLAEYGEEFGVPKPKIENWENQTQQEYDHRVMQDTRIQYRLWQDQERFLQQLYYGNKKATYMDFVNYLMTKAKHLRIAQDNPVDLDVQKAQEYSKEWSERVEAKLGEIASVMPKVPVYVMKNPPKRDLFKLNGTLSVSGEKWVKLLALHEIDNLGYSESFKILKEMKDGNANSVTQMKDWLFNLGWVPETFKFERNKETGETRRIPQIYIPKSDGKLDPGIKALISKFEEIKLLEGLGVLKHRVSVVNGFLEAAVDGKVVARAQGLTNTLRLKHKDLVNMPSPRVWGGAELRSLLGAGEGYECMGSDQSSLEDRVKQHFQWPLDPEYVKAQMKSDYDPHLAVCLMGNLMTEEQVTSYKMKTVSEEVMKALAKIRSMGKSTNYACQYGAGIPTIARSASVDMETAERLYKGYWRLNWSVKRIAEECVTKTFGKYKWLYNPVNGFWYYLKKDKDRFSTLCQGTGTYVFDRWLDIINDICLERYKREMPLMGQWHDEGLWRTKLQKREIWQRIITTANERLNNILNMNREFASEPEFGPNYADVH